MITLSFMPKHAPPLLLNTSSPLHHHFTTSPPHHHHFTTTSPPLHHHITTTSPQLHTDQRFKPREHKRIHGSLYGSAQPVYPEVLLFSRIFKR